MGKKRIVKKTAEETVKGIEKIESLLKRGLKLKPSQIPKEGNVYIYSSYNNTILNLTDLKGNTIYQVSAGKVGFSGTKEGTPYAGAKVAEVMSNIIKALGIEKINVLVKGIGSGRDMALRTLAAKGVNIVSIKDITPIPHDGCRPKKERRV